MAHSEENGFTLLGGREVELDESYFGEHRRRERRALRKAPVFGILERNGKVKVSVVKDVTVRTLLDLTVKTVRRNSIDSDKPRSYDSLMFCGYRHLKVNHRMGRIFLEKVYINGLEGIWNWAKERSIKYHRIFKETFSLYLKELEFRYNHHHLDIFDKLTDFPGDLVPNTFTLVLSNYINLHC